MQFSATPAYKPLYNISQKEFLVLKKYFNENLKKGFICPSFSPTASPMLFIRKLDENLRFYVNYYKLNTFTIKNRYSLLLINETLACILKAKYFTKLNIVSAFNKLKMAIKEKWKTAFCTYYKLYKYFVMPFSLANILSFF